MTDQTVSADPKPQRFVAVLVDPATGEPIVTGYLVGVDAATDPRQLQGHIVTFRADEAAR